MNAIVVKSRDLEEIEGPPYFVKSVSQQAFGLVSTLKSVSTHALLTKMTLCMTLFRIILLYVRCCVIFTTKMSCKSRVCTCPKCRRNGKIAYFYRDSLNLFGSEHKLYVQPRLIAIFEAIGRF